MKVVTLDDTGLKKAAENLAVKIHEFRPDGFDAVVGIRSGGAIVCDYVCAHMPPAYCGVRCDVTLRRPSSKRKEGKIGAILSQLPIFILNALRMAESVALNVKHKLFRRGVSQIKRPIIPDNLVSLLKKTGNARILVVDDAVDSGVTLRSVCDEISHLGYEPEICSAVVTVTTAHPEIVPDITLYNNHTLIRFPWSKDFNPSLRYS